MSFKVVIPARFASSRLPGKPLIDFAGKPMVVWVAERAAAAGADEVLIATDHPDILAVAREHGVEAMMTRADHPTGTDRLAEVVALRGWHEDAVVVNVQGDEPLIESDIIRRVALELTDSDAAIATVAHPIAAADDFFSANVVKVVCDARGYAHTFSRAPIPWARDAFAQERGFLPEGLPALRHVGLYAYRAAFLMAYCRLGVAPDERFESLEQLRALWHGYRIKVAVVSHPPAPGVDTPEDVDRVRALFAASAH